MYTRVLVAGSLRRGRFKRDRMKTTFSPVINTVTRAGLWPPPAFCPPPTSKFMSHDRTFPGCSGNVVSPSLRCIVKLDEKTRSNKFVTRSIKKEKRRIGEGGKNGRKREKRRKTSNDRPRFICSNTLGGGKSTTSLLADNCHIRSERTYSPSFTPNFELPTTTTTATIRRLRQLSSKAGFHMRVWRVRQGYVS